MIGRILNRLIGLSLFLIPFILGFLKFAVGGEFYLLQFTPLIQFIFIIWVTHIINWSLCRGGLSYIFGIHPRQFFSFPSIVLSHFLHIVDERGEGRTRNAHLISNTAQLWAAGGSLIVASSHRMPFRDIFLFEDLFKTNGLSKESELFVAATISIGLISGIGIWLMGRDQVYYVGAQGIIYGYIGFLLIYGIDIPIQQELFERARSGLREFGQLAGSIFAIGPGKIVFLLLGTIYIFLKIKILERLGFIFGILLQIRSLTEADLPVPDELKQAIPSGEQFLGQVLEILLLNYPESVLFGFLGGVLTAYCVMTFA